MAQQQASRDLGSFVSFALAQKPQITLQRHCKNDPVRGVPIRIDFEGQREGLKQSQVDTLEALLKRYEPLRDLLLIDPAHVDDKAGFNIETCEPRVEFKPGVQYELIKISGRQAALAKKVADLAEKAHASHAAGDHAAAKAGYAELERLLVSERETLVGDLGKLDRIKNIVGLHGVGQNGNPAADGDCGGMVIFVIIEIFVAATPDFAAPVLAVRR